MMKTPLKILDNIAAIQIWMKHFLSEGYTLWAGRVLDRITELALDHPHECSCKLLSQKENVNIINAHNQSPF